MNKCILFFHLNSLRILKTLSLFSVKQNLFSKKIRHFFSIERKEFDNRTKNGIFLFTKKFYKTFDFRLHQIIWKLVYSWLFKSIRFDKIYGILQADINFRSFNPLFFLSSSIPNSQKNEFRFERR